jgi:quercetin dioxygenase-like cupin family protein
MTRPSAIVGCLAVAGVLAMAPAQGFGQAAATAQPRISAVKLLDNDRVSVSRLTFPPGAREEVHITPQDLVVTQATSGEVEVTLNTETTTGRVETGKTWYVSKVTPHAYSNVGKEPFDLVVIFLK